MGIKNFVNTQESERISDERWDFDSRGCPCDEKKIIYNPKFSPLSDSVVVVNQLTY
jgi:hypothetical protein